MESFLSTLPPYVHDYLNKQPPTDVFNVLRELICFAVLYSNDREQLAAKTTELLEKGADKPVERKSGSGDSEIVQGGEKDDDGHATTSAAEKGQEEPRETSTQQENTAAPAADEEEEKTGKTKARDKSNVLYTFPEWWGHHDGSEEKNDAQKTLSQEPSVIETETKKPARRETVGTWVPWDEPTKKVESKPAHRTSSKPIPNLRSYLDPPRRSTPSPSPPASRASVTPGTTAPKRSSTQVSASSARNTATAAASAKTPSSAPMSRTPSTYRPGMTAAVRARQEHARAKEQKMEEEKARALQLNRINLKLKQQAKSSIDWDTVKKERRRTMPIIPSNT